MKKGVVFGRSMLGYDVKNGEMTVNPEGAEIVRKIFYQFTEEDLSVSQIARNLDALEILPMYAKKWNPSVVLRILKNEKYRGDLKQKKTYTPDYLSHEKKTNRGEEEFVWIRNHHEAIVTEEIFEKASEKLSKGKNPFPSGGKYPFSGKIICGICGKKYTARFQTSANGTSYRFWRCNSESHAKKRMLHSEDMIGMLSMLAERIFGVQTKDEKILASFLSKAIISGDSLKIYLFGESSGFSFRYALGNWKPDLEHEKKNVPAQKNGDILEKYGMKNNET
jgi:hypothetical protein